MKATLHMSAEKAGEIGNGVTSSFQLTPIELTGLAVARLNEPAPRSYHL
jgi:hypothetical protein